MRELLVLFVLPVVLVGCGDNQKLEAQEDVPKEKMVEQEKSQVDKEELKLQEMDKLLAGEKYDEFLDEFQSVDSESTYLYEFKNLGADFIDALIVNNNQKFIDSNFETLISNTILRTTDRNKIIDIKINELLAEMEKMIRNNEIDNAVRYYETNKIIQEDTEGNVLYNYALYLQKGESSYVASSELATVVNPTYDGRMNKEISNAVMDEGYAEIPISFVEWEAKYNVNKREIKQQEVDSQKVNPSIGMTAEEVKDSTWGEPKDINRTTTEYGTSEQWVYPNYKYIYLDDGIVTTIQE